MAKFFPVSVRSRTQEQRQVAFMLATGFFMGVFIATYQVTADSLFLNRLGHLLDKAFLITGILGILSTSIFSFLQNYLTFSRLTLLVTAGVFTFSVVVYVLLHYGNPEWENALVFAMFAFSGPIIALLLLSYWGTFGRLFNFRQSKRIIGWIDTGQLIAAIAASFLIPLSATLVPETSDYLLVCSISIFMVGVLLAMISGRFELSKNNPREFDEDVRKQSSIRKMFSDKYILIMSGLLVVSMTVFVLNQFSFQELVKVQFPDQRALTDFNAFFTGAVYALSLIMQTFVNNRIISSYGLRVSLFILPIILVVMSIGSIVAGSIFGYDKVASPTGFIFFFIFVAMSRLFNWTLRESLENPVFKLFFIPLDNRIRFNVQARVEGLVNESARFLAGLLIFGLAFIPTFKVIHISGFLVVLGVIYFVAINRLYGGYKDKIREKLESSEFQQDKLEKGFTQITHRLEGMMASPDSAKAIFSYKLLEKINAGQTNVWVNNLIRNPDDSVKHYAQEKMNEMKGLSVSDKYVIRMDQTKVDSEEKSMLSIADLQMIIDNNGDITKQRIQRLSRSQNPSDRQYAAELLLHTSAEDGISFLIELLSDSEAKVRNTAIKSAVKKNNPEVINALIENMGNPVYSNQAMNAIVLIGTKTLPALDVAFYRSGQSTHLMQRIIQATGRIGGQRARDLLWNKIDYPNKIVVSQVLLSLGECGFKAGISQVTRIKYAIEADIADIRWNLSAMQEIGDDSFKIHIINSLRWEIQNDIEHIYMLLAMLYDTRSIQLVKENIDSGTPEGITYAVELLDVFLSEQLKQRVIPILDDISDTERINKLDIYYPRIKLDSKLVLKFLINRDFTQSNRWTKACILYEIGLQRIEDFKLDLIAQLFNPDPLISEVAAWALSQIDETEFRKNVQRLPPDQSKSLNDVITTYRMSRFSKVMFFKEVDVFRGVPGITLSQLADISSEIVMNEGDTLPLDEKVNNNFYVLAKGEVDFYQRGDRAASFSAGQFIGELLSLPNFVTTNLIKANTRVSLLSINKDQFYELLSDDVRLTDKVLEFV
ncbi:MAG: HEAT repeat domain-containing protein [Cyclobacteriaceae bacterium]|nr:HEAT repeat domain-containing protein [Cyclobacteriaceae bacterium]